MTNRHGKWLLGFALWPLLACSSANSGAALADAAVLSANIDSMFTALASAMSSNSAFVSRGKTAATMTFANFASSAGIQGDSNAAADFAQLDKKFGSIAGMFASTGVPVGTLTHGEVEDAYSLSAGKIDVTTLDPKEHAKLAAESIKVSMLIWLTMQKTTSSLALDTFTNVCVSQNSILDPNAKATCTTSIQPGGSGSTTSTTYANGDRQTVHKTGDGTTKITQNQYTGGGGQQITEYDTSNANNAQRFTETCSWANGQRGNCMRQMGATGATTCYPQGTDPSQAASGSCS